MKIRSLSIAITILIILGSACGINKTSLRMTGTGMSAVPVIPDCRQANLVSETISPGTEYQAGIKFVKTWVIRNTSPCDWSNQVSLVYYDGVGMGASTHTVITENMPGGVVIHPGQTATVTLNLRTPFAPGEQVGYWKLRDPSGILFVPSNSAQSGLSVDINIVGTIYSFVDNICKADWNLDGQHLDCPYTGVDDSVGLLVDHFPRLETGGVENESAIQIRLPQQTDSTLTAIYPAMIVSMGDRLHIITSCAYESPQCDLIFKVGYHSKNSTGVLGVWHEVSDNHIQSANLDLSDLVGKEVQFIFSVRSNGMISNNQGYWFFPVLLPY